MSSYFCAPPQGHVNWLKRVYGYLRRNPYSATCFCVEIPNQEALATPHQSNWSYAIYRPVTEERPPDQPLPRGKPMRTTTYKDANLCHDLVTGHAMCGIIHFFNQTHIFSHCKKQKTVKTATFGFQFNVAQQACEQIIDLSYTLCTVGIPLLGPSWMFGDNASVITASSKRPFSTLPSFL
jgi:hypothetical protein